MNYRVDNTYNYIILLCLLSDFEYIQALLIILDTMPSEFYLKHYYCTAHYIIIYTGMYLQVHILSLFLCVLIHLFITVIEQLMHRLAEKCPKIIRVYSEMLENQVFPIPRECTANNVLGRKYV